MSSYCEYCGGAFAPNTFRCDNCGAPKRRGSEVQERPLSWTNKPGEVIPYVSYPQWTPIMPQLRKLRLENPTVAAFGIDGDSYSVLYQELVQERRMVNTMQMDAGFTAIEFMGIPVFVDPRLPRGAIRLVKEGERYDGGRTNERVGFGSTAAREGSVWAGRLEERGHSR